MKKYHLFFFLLFTTGILYSQEFLTYEYVNQELFSGESIVFTENYMPPIELNNYYKSFTISEREILDIESILIQQYHEDLADSGIAWYDPNENIKKKFRCYNRQYLGYIDKNGSKKVIINLLNFNYRKRANKKFKGWKEFFFFGHGKYYEKNTIIFTKYFNK